MRTKTLLMLAGALLAVAGFRAVMARAEPRPATARAAAQPPASDNKVDEANRAAIRKSARDFEKAFATGDPKAVAAFWTDDGEFQDSSGDLIIGRADIEKAFAEFFKHNAKPKLEILIDSIRFPAPNMAIEEGLLRQSGGGRALPTTTLYSVTHCRGPDGWRIATVREWGAGQHRLEDLEWLVGTWKAKVPDGEVTLTFARDPKKPFINAEFAKKAKDKVVTSGTMRIGIDPQRGQLRSWHFEDDGGHGQSLWLRDGNNWVLDCIGVNAEGAPHEAVNILGRLNGNEITWRSIDRVVGDQPLPDTAPVKLVRTQKGGM